MGRCFLGGGGVRGYFCPSTVYWLAAGTDPSGQRPAGVIGVIQPGG